tara:strand:- start:25 stop:1182 length:1158 start_codon:yes stop_codon:yes gene_type:complete
MRLLRIIPSLDVKLGGPQVALIKITPYLEKKNFQTTVITLDDPNANCLKNLPFKTIGLGPVFSKYGYKRGIAKKIQEISSNQDFVIIHGIWQYHSFAAWRALNKTNIPYFVYTHGMLDPFYKNYFPLKHIKKSIYWHLAEYKVIRDAKAILFTSEKERLLARKSFWLYKANEKVVEYGTQSPPKESEVSKDIFLHEYPHLKNKRIFLFLSRIDYKKGLDILIKAFAKISIKDNNLALVIAGPDPVGQKVKLKKLAKMQQVDKKITWTGMLWDDMKWSAYRSAELFCLPSHSENFGIVIAEALSCGIPVATTDKVNIYGEILAAKAGLIEENNLEAFTRLLKKWLSLNHAEKLQIGLNAKNLFNEKFDIKKSQTKLIEILKNSQRK